LILELLEHLELLASVEAVGQVALVGVGQRPEVLGPSDSVLRAAAQQAARLVGQPVEGMANHLLAEVLGDLDRYHVSRKCYRRDRIHSGPNRGAGALTAPRGSDPARPPPRPRCGPPAPSAGRVRPRALRLAPR